MEKLHSNHEVTQLLQNWQGGRQEALEQLIPLVHHTLHQLADRYMRKESAGHTLQATALVNEAYLKLCDANVTWKDRAHFKAIAANNMRRILIDHARAQRSSKRGGDELMVTLYETQIADNGNDPDILDIEDALIRLAELDERKSKIVELSFFGGMTHEEIAEAVGVSVNTVDRDLRFAKAWLKRDLSDL